MRAAAMAFLLVGGLCLAGCGLQQLALGAQQGYLLTTQDVLTLPGKQVPLEAQLRHGDFLQDKPGYVARFYQAGQLLAAAETDDDGVATVWFDAKIPGDTLLSVDFSPNGFSSQRPGPADLLIACRPAQTPIVIVDLDGTLVASGPMEVLLGDPQPMEHARQVMQRLAGQYTILYLTSRPEMLGPRTKSWLNQQGFPRCPVLLAEISSLLAGQEKYKTARIGRIRQDFSQLRYGIGNDIADATAYQASGLTPILLLDAKGKKPDQLWELVRRLQQLDESAQVVKDWRQVEQVIFEKASFPRSAAQRELMELAGRLEMQQAEAPSSQAASGPASASRPAESCKVEGGMATLSFAWPCSGPAVARTMGHSHANNSVAMPPAPISTAPNRSDR